MTSNLWIRPVLLVLLWMMMATYTVSELVTIPRALASAAAQEPAMHALAPLRGRGPVLSQRTSRP
jgi:hypothetical protein